MGVPLDQGQSLEDFFQLPQLTKDDTEFYRLKLLQRSELLYLGQLLEAADRDRSAAKGNNLPRVDLTLAHDEYGDSISPTNGDFDEDDKLMLTASWNLFNGFATHQSVAVADSRKRGISAELQDTRDALFLQLQTALSDIRVAQGKLQEALSGITQAEENYRVTKSRYRQQQATTFDLLDARFLLTRARNQEINARYDLHSKAAVLDRVLERDLRH
jgi:outer membrane protein